MAFENEIEMKSRVACHYFSDFPMKSTGEANQREYRVTL